MILLSGMLTLLTSPYVFVQKSADSVWSCLAVAILKGKMKGQEVFLNIIQAQMSALDHLKHGVGKQNFNYSATLQEFSHIAAIISPEAYQELSMHLQLPASQTHAYVNRIMCVSSRLVKLFLGTIVRKLPISQQTSVQRHLRGHAGTLMTWATVPALLP